MFKKKNSLGPSVQKGLNLIPNSPKAQRNAANFLLLVNMFSALHNSSKSHWSDKNHIFRSMKHKIFVSAFTSFFFFFFFKRQLQEFNALKKGKVRRTFVVLKKGKYRIGLVSYNTFVRDVASNPIKVVKFGINPWISLLMMVRIQWVFQNIYASTCLLSSDWKVYPQTIISQNELWS